MGLLPIEIKYMSTKSYIEHIGISKLDETFRRPLKCPGYKIILFEK
jgi:hypothetical protein